MSLVYHADVFCDACGNWHQGIVSGRQNIGRLARKDAAKNGWAVGDTRSKYRDLCPSCLEQYQQGKLPVREGRE